MVKLLLFVVVELFCPQFETKQLQPFHLLHNLIALPVKLDQPVIVDVAE